MKKLLLSGLKSKNKRVKGAELVIFGGLALFLNVVLPYMAPIAFILYGIYRLALQKNYPEGIISIAFGILIWIFLKKILYMILLVGGIVLLVYGMYLLFSPQKEKTDDKTTP